ncbi:MAG: hypothetical protein KF718_16895 [Polyangiaceae bacterium]|nr:hypothetical protein [Polyangiaceae bacterium]
MTPLRSLVRLEHRGGAKKEVELVGFTPHAGGEALLFWPSSGHLTVRLRDGLIYELRNEKSLTAQWRVPDDQLEQLRQGFKDG